MATVASGPLLALVLLAGVTVIMLGRAAVHTFTEDDRDAASAAAAPPPGADLNYGVIVDAGSSGSRVFLYSWPPHPGDQDKLISVTPVADPASGLPAVLKVSPGLSSFEDTPDNATESLRPLVTFAQTHVPVDKRKATPLFVMATAGMRLLPHRKRDAIMDALRRTLPTICDFQVIDEHIEIIDGKWEGVYSWVAVNYILNRFEHTDVDDSHNEWARPDTVGMIDMGGASVQIAFEYAGAVAKQQAHLVETINLGCEAHALTHTYHVYVVTFLGLGANEAINSYEKQLARLMYHKRIANESKATSTLSPMSSSVSTSPFGSDVPSTQSVPYNLDVTNSNVTQLNALKRVDAMNVTTKFYNESASGYEPEMVENVHYPPAAVEHNVPSDNSDVAAPATAHRPSVLQTGLRRRKRSDANQLPPINIEPHDLQPPPVDGVLQRADSGEGSTLDSSTATDGGIGKYDSGLEARMVTFAYDDNGLDSSDEEESRRPIDVTLGTARDPCLPRNVVKHVRVALALAGADRQSSVSLWRRGTGDYDRCAADVRPLLRLNATCGAPPCSMRGVHQPHRDMAQLEMYGFSEYWYSMHDILNYGGGHLYDFEEFRQRAKSFCATRWSVMRERLRRRLYPRADAARLRTQCFKSAWIATVLHDGFGVPRAGGKFKAVQEIRGQEVQWTLGALLFKMRYFPLRDIERKRAEAARVAKLTQSSSYYPSDSAPSPTQVLLICLFSLLVAAWVAYRYGYLTKIVRLLLRQKQLRQGVTRGRSGNLPRPKSMYGYMMMDRTSDDELMEGVRVESAKFVY